MATSQVQVLVEFTKNIPGTVSLIGAPWRKRFRQNLKNKFQIKVFLGMCGQAFCLWIARIRLPCWRVRPWRPCSCAQLRFSAGRCPADTQRCWRRGYVGAVSHSTNCKTKFIVTYCTHSAGTAHTHPHQPLSPRVIRIITKCGTTISKTPHVMTLNSHSVVTLVDPPAGEHPGLIRSSSNKLLTRLISVMRQQDVRWPVDLWQGVSYIPSTHYCASFFLCTICIVCGPTDW